MGPFSSSPNKTLGPGAFAGPEQTATFPFRPADDGGEEPVVDGNKTFFGPPARGSRPNRSAGIPPEAQANPDATMAPWSRREPTPQPAPRLAPEPADERQTLSPWASRQARPGQEPVDARAQTHFGFHQTSEAAERSTQMGLPRIDLDAGPPPDPPSRQRTAFGLGHGQDAPAPGDEQGPTIAPRPVIRDERRATLMGLPAQRIEPLPDAPEEGQPPRGLAPIPSKSKVQQTLRSRVPAAAREPRHTAPMPALFTEADSVDEDAPQEGEGGGGNLFKIPSASGLKARSRAPRQTLMGAPSVSADQLAAEDEPVSGDTTNPGQYIVKKGQVGSEKIRIGGQLKLPSAIGAGGDGAVGKSRSRSNTAAMAVPVVGAASARQERQEPAPSLRKPSATMRLSVPVLGEATEQAPEPSVGPASEEPSISIQTHFATPQDEEPLPSRAPSTMRLSVPAAVNEARQEARAAAAAGPVREDLSSGLDDFFDEEEEEEESGEGGDTVQTRSVEELFQALQAAEASAQSVTGFGETQELDFPGPAAPAPASAPVEPPQARAAVAPPAEPAPVRHPQPEAPPRPEVSPQSPADPEPVEAVAHEESAPVAEVAPVAETAPARSQTSVRVAALLGGVGMLLMPALVLASMGGVAGLNPVTMVSVFFPALGGLMVLAAGAIKFPPVMRATILTLAGALTALLMAFSQLGPLASYGDTLTRLVAITALLLPVGLFWRARYPSSTLSRVVVGVGMMLLVLNYFLPDASGSLRILGLVGGFSQGLGGLAVSAVALIPLALLLPSLLAFTRAPRTGFGVLWASLLCAWWVPMALVGGFSSGALLAAGLGMGLFGASMCMAAGMGDVFGWLSDPEAN